MALRAFLYSQQYTHTGSTFSPTEPFSDPAEMAASRIRELEGKMIEDLAQI